MRLDFRLVEENDAEFILRLRTNPKMNKFINQPTENIDSQIEWIKKYKSREAQKKEFYYIIFESGKPRGTYRLYNINSISFTIGSWLFEPCTNPQIPILTDLAFSDFGFYDLKLNVLLFEIRKQNRKVISYHLIKKPLLYNENELNFFYLITRDNWSSSRKSITDYFAIK